jgi:uncharacterized membrane protein YdjX (TVP38/TMEM64 family)
VKRLLLAVALLAGVTLVIVYRDRLDPALVEAQLDALGIWAPIAFIGLYALGALLFAPGSVMTLSGGALFGPLWGSLFSLTGATLGAALGFLAGRYLAADWVAGRTRGRLKTLLEGVEAEGWRFVAFVRLVPLFPYNLLNYALGLTRIRLLPYLVTSFVCMAPGAVAYTWLGHAGRQAVAGSGDAVRNGLLALGLVAAVAFLPSLVRRLRRKRQVASDQGPDPG